MKVKELMTTPVLVISPNESIEKALKIMNDNQINGMPVIDKEEKIIGMVVKADIYRFLTTPGHYPSCPVEWVMSKHVINISLDTNLIDAAKKIIEHNITSLPVVNESKVEGILSMKDIVKHFIDISI